jgi:hypothetical protein
MVTYSQMVVMQVFSSENQQNANSVILSDATGMKPAESVNFNQKALYPCQDEPFRGR